ncbi:hypothetical protein VTL71DRAFT_10128 [Oculimacula yallundae]|uniref:Uncharacterized protein n=1 Tax=Oculimacula yallundae TaxID=86028 RepID=A0ABR4BPN4_9HELO
MESKDNSTPELRGQPVIDTLRSEDIEMKKDAAMEIRPERDETVTDEDPNSNIEQENDRGSDEDHNSISNCQLDHHHSESPVDTATESDSSLPYRHHNIEGADMDHIEGLTSQATYPKPGVHEKITESNESPIDRSAHSDDEEPWTFQVTTTDNNNTAENIQRSEDAYHSTQEEQVQDHTRQCPPSPAESETTTLREVYDPNDSDGEVAVEMTTQVDPFQTSDGTTPTIRQREERIPSVLSWDTSPISPLLLSEQERDPTDHSVSTNTQQEKPKSDVHGWHISPPSPLLPSTQERNFVHDAASTDTQMEESVSDSHCWDIDPFSPSLSSRQEQQAWNEQDDPHTGMPPLISEYGSDEEEDVATAIALSMVDEDIRQTRVHSNAATPEESGVQVVTAINYEMEVIICDPDHPCYDKDECEKAKQRYAEREEMQHRDSLPPSKRRDYDENRRNVAREAEEARLEEVEQALLRETENEQVRRNGGENEEETSDPEGSGQQKIHGTGDEETDEHGGFRYCPWDLVGMDEADFWVAFKTIENFEENREVFIKRWHDQIARASSNQAGRSTKEGDGWNAKGWGRSEEATGGSDAVPDQKGKEQESKQASEPHKETNQGDEQATTTSEDELEEATQRSLFDVPRSRNDIEDSSVYQNNGGRAVVEGVLQASDTSGSSLVHRLKPGQSTVPISDAGYSCSDQITGNIDSSEGRNIVNDDETNDGGGPPVDEDGQGQDDDKDEIDRGQGTGDGHDDGADEIDDNPASEEHNDNKSDNESSDSQSNEANGDAHEDEVEEDSIGNLEVGDESGDEGGDPNADNMSDFGSDAPAPDNMPIDPDEVAIAVYQDRFPVSGPTPLNPGLPPSSAEVGLPESEYTEALAQQQQHDREQEAQASAESERQNEGTDETARLDGGMNLESTETPLALEGTELISKTAEGNEYIDDARSRTIRQVGDASRTSIENQDPPTNSAPQGFVLPSVNEVLESGGGDTGDRGLGASSTDDNGQKPLPNSNPNASIPPSVTRQSGCGENGTDTEQVAGKSQSIDNNQELQTKKSSPGSKTPPPKDTVPKTPDTGSRKKKKQHRLSPWQRKKQKEMLEKATAEKTAAEKAKNEKAEATTKTENDERRKSAYDKRRDKEMQQRQKKSTASTKRLPLPTGRRVRDQVTETENERSPFESHGAGRRREAGIETTVVPLSTAVLSQVAEQVSVVSTDPVQGSDQDAQVTGEGVQSEAVDTDENLVRGSAGDVVDDTSVAESM